jgi:hypothetical protein
VLIVGAILAPGKRTVTAALRVMGLKDDRQYQNYHRVLNRAKWSGLEASRILLGLLVMALVGCGAPVIVAADETLERRWGPKIKEKGILQFWFALGEHDGGAGAVEPAAVGVAILDRAGPGEEDESSQ